mmetsp:Transcript_2563/g.7062  ORF Transcript_2563/g.7062 Transcript_2563/m.7062 type:complete len:286 (+) Transcript_2563:83-940(+)
MYHYRKCMPRANKILEEKWVKHCQDLHRKKLKEMRSYVDTTAPTTTRLSHLSENLKKQQLDEERYSQIERENYLLLDKMSYIMTHPQLLDEKYMGAPVSYGKSLNKEFRKRELMRITEENQQILRRIQQKEPHYSHLEWEEKARRDDEYLRNCSEYPNMLATRDSLMPKTATRTPRLAPLSSSKKSSRGETAPVGYTREQAAADRSQYPGSGQVGGLAYLAVAQTSQCYFGAIRLRRPCSREAGWAARDLRRARTPTPWASTRRTWPTTRSPPTTAPTATSSPRR